LEKNNGILRAEVATELMKSTRYVNTNLAPDDEHIVHGSLPAAMKAVILHARYIKDEGQTFMLEATLLQISGVPKWWLFKGYIQHFGNHKISSPGKALFVCFSAQKVSISTLKRVYPMPCTT
jgi:hypothetical protein